MKRSLILIASLSLSIIVQVATPAAQNVGEDFGKSWLQQHGTQRNDTENQTSLWSSGGECSYEAA